MKNNIDVAQLKPRIREYLMKRGIEIVSTDADRIRCLSHSDEHASMIIYERSAGKKMDGLYCPVCDSKLDIFEAARIIAGIPGGDANFPSVIDEVVSTLGESSVTGQVINSAPTIQPKKEPEKNTSFVSLPANESSQYYLKTPILNLASKSLRDTVTEIEATWPNLNPDGTLAFVECRFPAKCFKDGKKKYLTFWFDGNRLRASNPPILLYNRDKLAANPETPFIIHEGPKSIFGIKTQGILGGESIPGFIPTGWNSGGKKWSICDFEPLRGREGFIYPDDDEATKTYPQGVGIATALDLKKYLGENYGCKVKVCTPLPEARKIKEHGADIIEALQVRTPEDMARYIIECSECRESEKTSEENRGNENSPRPPRPPVVNDGTDGKVAGHDNAGGRSAQASENTPTVDDFPFRILGTSDDGYMNFLDKNGRHVKYRAPSLTKNVLFTLADLSFWVTEYHAKNGFDLDQAVNDIITVSGLASFDPERLKGRGAWREKDGRICYHNGAETIGESDKNRIYLKIGKRDIGLDAEPASAELRNKMLQTAGLLSFETQADVVRCLGWSVLAPFGGALPWRPAGFVSGKSGSGKSTVIDTVIARLSLAQKWSGIDSTSAGIRQYDKLDSTPIIIDEAGDDSEKAMRNRNEIFSLMRQSTGGDAPKAVKGTVDGTAQVFALSKMFLFAAINEIVESIADKNRIFFVSMATRGDSPAEWSKIKKQLNETFTDENCQAVRAFVWQHLQEIITYAEWLTDLVTDEAGEGMGNRYSFLEAILFSAFLRVFQDKLPDEAEAREFLRRVYKSKAPEQHDDESDIMLARVFSEVVRLDGDYKKQETIGDILRVIKEKRLPDSTVRAEENELRPYIKTARFYGLAITKHGLAVAPRNPKLAEMLGSKEYLVMLARHSRAEKSKQVIGTFNARCLILNTDVIVSDEVPF